MNPHDQVLLAEARSAVTQCTHIIGDRIAKRILDLLGGDNASCHEGGTGNP